MTHGMPVAEIDLSDELITHLLTTQHPDLADLPLRVIGEGWDNLMVRLGASLQIRLPRRAFAEPLIRIEQTWLPQLAERLSLAVSAPIRIGRPDDRYPWHWSILEWIDGVCADQSPPDPAEAGRLMHCLRQLHHPAPAEAPRNPHRSQSMVQLEASAQQTFAAAEAQIGSAAANRVRGLWQQGLDSAPPPTPIWIHGDLHAQNVIIDGGRIAALIDWGDLCAGDPATDLASIWGLFDSVEARQQALEVYQPDPDLLRRALAWTALFATTLIKNGAINSTRHRIQGEVQLARLLADH